MSNVNILFYSNNCEGSKVLMSLMKNEGLLNFFHLVCTDNNPSVPPQIKLTPTLVIKNLPMPYIASGCFNWLAKIKQWKINTQLQRMSNLQQQYLQKSSDNLNGDSSNLLGFSQTEMEGMSDIFAYIEEEHAIPHSYFNCNQLGKEQIFAPPREASKLNATKQSELHNKLNQERRKQDEEFKTNIDNFKKQYG